jgi:predicted chitinase
MIAEDQALTDPRHIAYLLATVRHETAFTFAPIEEYGKGTGHEYGITDPQTGKVYYGRGFVQITWKANYDKFGKLFGIDLVNHPELVLSAPVSYGIASSGMRKGLFTGLGFSSGAVNNSGVLDFTQARRIINGLDQADKIADYAEKFLVMLGEN